MLRKLKAGTHYEHYINDTARLLEFSEPIERQRIVYVQALRAEQQIKRLIRHPTIEPISCGRRVKGLVRAKAPACRRMVELGGTEGKKVYLRIDQPVVVARNAKRSSGEFH